MDEITSNSEFAEDESRYCHTYEEALGWARAHNAKVEEENK